MRTRQRGFLRPGIALGVLAATLATRVPAIAQVTLNGPPIQVTPYVSEPGVPLVTITPGTANSLAGDGDPSGTDTGTSGTSAGSSDALNTLLAQPWGAEAVSEAEAVGVNPSALAATCVAESGCTNAGTNGTATGAFQMQSAAFQDGLQTALAADPSLASQIVQGSAGMSDPTTEAVAASGYLMEANSALLGAGISDPTVLDARAFYNFGPASGTQLATALPSETVAAAMPSVSAATLARNGVTPGETVAQWQTAETSVIGNAANASILS